MQGSHVHDWKYNEAIEGFTVTQESNVLRFCIRCYLLERIKLHKAPENKDHQPQ